MSYMKIENLYRPQAQSILLLREVFALEKIHGTSAHLTWTNGVLSFSSGGEKHERFVAAVSHPDLVPAFERMGHAAVTIYGEAYGGSQQKQAWRYGPALRFVAFEARVGEVWLAVPNAAGLVASLGLEFVHYARVSTDLAALDAERDAPSEQARRNGVEGDKPREGVVLRPIVELTLSNGERVMAKHKRAEERETATPREVVDPSRLAVLANADAIALEWVTPTRLAHVLQAIGGEPDIRRMREVISGMQADVLREGAGEIVDSKEARASMGRRTAEIFRAHLEQQLREVAPP